MEIRIDGHFEKWLVHQVSVIASEYFGKLIEHTDDHFTLDFPNNKNAMDFMDDFPTSEE